jgi:hypothetical protein
MVKSLKTISSPHAKGKKSEKKKIILPSGMRALSNKEIEEMIKIILKNKARKRTGSPSTSVARKP